MAVHNVPLVQLRNALYVYCFDFGYWHYECTAVVNCRCLHSRCSTVLGILCVHVKIRLL